MSSPPLLLHMRKDDPIITFKSLPNIHFIFFFPSTNFSAMFLCLSPQVHFEDKILTSVISIRFAFLDIQEAFIFIFHS